MNSRLRHEWEDRIEATLKQVNPEPTPSCLTEETLWDFAQQGGEHLEAKPIISHLTTCLYCYQGYSRMIEFQHLSMAPQETTSFKELVLLPFALLTRLSHRLRIPRVQHTLQTGGVALATGLAVFFLSTRFFHPSIPPPRNSLGEHEIAARETAVASQEQTVKMQQEDADKRIKTIEADRRKLVLDQHQLEQNIKAFKQRQHVEQRSQNAHAGQDIPDIRKLAYVFHKEAGITLPIVAGSVSTEDPLPFALYWPLPDATVRHDTLIFSWEAFKFPMDQDGLQGARSYRVEFWSVDGSNEAPKRSPLLKTTSWQPAHGEGPLPGRKYAWIVLAYHDETGNDLMHIQSPQRIRFQFRTLNQLELKRLASCRASLLQLGTILAEAHMWKDAQQAFQTYLIAMPDDAKAQQWLQKVQQLRQESMRHLDARLQQFSQFDKGKESEGIRKLRNLIAVTPSDNRKNVP